MRFLILIPAFNEEATIADVVRRVPRDLPGVDHIEVAVVDDGSTDQTARWAREAGATLLSHLTNRGLGAAFQTGVRYAIEQGADIVVTMDGDGQFDPDDISEITRPLIEGGAAVVTASRFADAELIPEMPRVKRLGNALVTAIVGRITGHPHKDVSCGFRAYSREVLLRLTVRASHTYIHEVLLDLASKGIPIVEVPVSVRGVRRYGESKFASKISRYGMKTALIIVVFWRKLDIVLEPASPVPNTSVLDFGCGTGVLLSELAQEDRTVFATDLVLDGARDLSRHLGSSDITFFEGDSWKDQIAPESLQLVVAANVLEHVDERQPLLRAMQAILAPGFLLVVSGHTENLLYWIGRRIVGFSGLYYLSNIMRVLADCDVVGLKRVAHRSHPLPGRACLYQVASFMPNSSR
ncbi:MAG: hypothetical protein CME06_11180 [Gemmatimonadetes bacterium]|nr:hypothetical protein [Gemmatimonadota bacterium]